MLSPSTATERLADIAYQITLQRSQSEANADKKRSKWSQIPAFLVAMVRTTRADPLYPEEEAMEPFVPLDYVPPQTERELEDVSY
jgi:Nitroreductase family